MFVYSTVYLSIVEIYSYLRHIIKTSYKTYFSGQKKNSEQF